MAIRLSFRLSVFLILCSADVLGVASGLRRRILRMHLVAKRCIVWSVFFWLLAW